MFILIVHFQFSLNTVIISASREDCKISNVTQEPLCLLTPRMALLLGNSYYIGYAHDDKPFAIYFMNTGGIAILSVNLELKYFLMITFLFIIVSPRLKGPASFYL